MPSFIDIPEEVEIKTTTTWQTAGWVALALALGIGSALTFYAWIRKKF